LEEELLERLEKLEELMREIVERLEALEQAIGLIDEGAAVAARLAVALSLPGVRAVEAARRVVALLSGREGAFDALDKAVVEAMATCEELTITEIARRVKRIRGTASRTTIRARLRRLEGIGLVRRVKHGSRTLYTLAVCTNME